MPLNCSPAFFSTVIGPINQLNRKQKRGLIIKYLYYRLNPSKVGTPVPASTLLKNAIQFDQAPSDSSLESMLVWIERQAAIDAGAFAAGPFNITPALKDLGCLTCLPMDSLAAIEIMLRCQLS